MTRAEQRLSPNPNGDDGGPLSSLLGSLFSATGEFTFRTGERAATLRISSSRYRDLCKELRLMAMPRLWGYRLRVDDQIAGGAEWRLESEDGSLYLADDGSHAWGRK